MVRTGDRRARRGGIVVGLDVRVTEHAGGGREHRLAARGGTAGGDLWETLGWLDAEGCARYVVTDVSRDGTLLGPNLDLSGAVARAVAAPVIASGGIPTIDDLVILAETAAGIANLEGAIFGTALSTGRFTLSDALDAVTRAGAVTASKADLRRATGTGRS